MNQEKDIFKQPTASYATKHFPIYDKAIHLLPSDLIKIFQTDKTTIIRKENAGAIPKSTRVMRGKIIARAWTIDQLPEIGEELGYLDKCKSQHIISVFTLKGGTLKTSVSFQLARILALHNYKVLVIGLDLQGSITGILRGDPLEDDHWDEEILNNPPKGLYDFFARDTPMDEIIKETDIKTLKYIPETFELSLLDRWMKNEKYQEQIFRKRLLPSLDGLFDLIIFDCNPSWDTKIDNVLDVSDILLSPITCSTDTLRALKVFSEMIDQHISLQPEHQFNAIKVIPTRRKNTNVSSIIEGMFRRKYSALCTETTIRESVASEITNSIGRSLIELNSHKNGLTSDYISLVKEISKVIISSESTHPLH